VGAWFVGVFSPEKVNVWKDILENNTLKITSLQIASMRKQALSWGEHGRMASMLGRI
jgi:hypothetical protein